jgi:hypothetical protein
MLKLVLLSAVSIAISLFAPITISIAISIAVPVAKVAAVWCDDLLAPRAYDCALWSSGSAW